MPRRLLKFGIAVRSRIVMIASDGGSIRRPRPGVGTWAGSGAGGSGFASSAGPGAIDGIRKSGGPSPIGAHCPVRFRSEKITVPSACLHFHVSAWAVETIVAMAQHAMANRADSLFGYTRIATYAALRGAARRAPRFW